MLGSGIGALARLICVCSALFAVSAASGSTWRSVGVASNLLLDKDRLIFLQFDGSLTSLDAATGAVLARVPSDATDFGSGVWLVSDHIVISGYRELRVLDRDSFALVNSIVVGDGAAPGSDVVISLKAWKELTASRIPSGDTAWSRPIGSEDRFYAYASVTIVLETDATSASIALLDNATGAELHRSQVPANERYEAAWLTDGNVYVERRPESADRIATVTRLMAIDATGSTISVRLLDDASGNSASFSADKKDVSELEQINAVTFRSRHLSYRVPRTGQTTVSVPLSKGKLLIRSVRHGDQGPDEFASYTGSDGNVLWSGYLPYLSRQQASGLDAVQDFGGRLYLGSDGGHVECVDLRSGESQWMYLFGSHNQIRSFSSPRGLPPYLATQARTFHQNMAMPIESGIVTVPPGTLADHAALWNWLDSGPARPTRIIRDPQPSNPFKEVPRLLVEAWIYALISLGALLAFAFARRRVKGRTRYFGDAALMASIVGSAFGLLLLGRVAFSSTIAMKLAVISAMIASLYAAYDNFRSGKRIWAIIMVIIVAALSVVFSAPLRFA